MYRLILLLTALSLLAATASCASPPQPQSPTDGTSAQAAPEAAPDSAQYPALNESVEGLEPRPDDVALIVAVEEYAFLPNVVRSFVIPTSAPAQLGASVNEMNAELAQTFDLDESFGGLVIVEVIPGTAADRYGFQAGDVITHIDESPVHSGEELRQAIQQRTAGTEVDFHYIRDNRRGHRAVVLGEPISDTSSTDADGGDWMLLYATSSGRDLWIFGAVIPEEVSDVDSIVEDFVDLVSSARFVMPQ